MATLDELRSALTPLNGRVVIAGDIGTAVGRLIAGSYAGQPIVITGATATAADGSVVLSGRSRFLGVDALPTIATVTPGPDGEVGAKLEYALSGPASDGVTWRPSSTFPAMPLAAVDPSGITDELRPLMDGLHLLEARGVASTHPLRPGVTAIEGRVEPTGLLAVVAAVLAGDDQPDGPRGLAFTGTVVVPSSSVVTTPLRSLQQPWELPAPPPGMLLEIALGDVALGTNLVLEGAASQVYCPPSHAWMEANDTYEPTTGWTGRLRIPSAEVTVDLTASGSPGDDTVLLRGEFEGVPVARLASLLDLTGSADLATTLPDRLATAVAELASVELQSVSILLDVASATPSVLTAAVTVGLRDLSWTPFDDDLFKVTGLSCTIVVQSPFSHPAVGVTLFGTVEIEGVPVQVTATSADGFLLQAEVLEGFSLPLHDLLRRHLPEVPAPSDLVVDTVYAGAGTAGYQLVVGMAPSDSPWTIDLGIGTVAFKDLYLGIAKPSGGSANGTFAGTVAFGDLAELSMGYDVPGSLALRAEAHGFTLRGLLHSFLGDVELLPDGFDVTFGLTYLVLESTPTGWNLRAGTKVEGLGLLALELRKVADGAWGVAVGLDLELSRKASSVDGLSALAVFEDVFRLDRVCIVVASFTDPTFTLADMKAFQAPVLAGTTLTLPGSGVMQGFNAYARWEIDGTDLRQGLLRDLLGLQSTVGVALQVGLGATPKVRLSVDYQTTVQGHPLRCKFGGQLSSGGIQLFLQGSFDVHIGDSLQTIDVELVFVENGAFVSGTLHGATAIEVFGLKLANLALQIGIDWEGIPSFGVAATLDAGFTTTLALLFDSTRPEKSLLAGSISDLTLADVVTEIADVELPEELTDVLASIGVEGTNRFEIPGSLADDLDNLRLPNVAAAFQSVAKIALSTSTSACLVVVGEPGERWHLTDKTPDGLRNYQVRRKGGALEASLEAQLYVAPQPTRIGSLEFPAGFFVTGTLRFLGLHATATIAISTGKGVLIMGDMSPIVIGTAALFSLTREGGDGGPTVSIASYEQPAHEVEDLRGRHVYVNGQLRFLGMRRALRVRITATGAELMLVGSFLPLTEFNLHGRFTSLTDLEIGGSIAASIGEIDLGVLGKVSIDAGVACTLDVKVKGTVFSATLRASAMVAGRTREVTLTLDVDADPLADLIGLLVTEVGAVIRAAFQQVTEWLGAVKDGVVEGVDNAAVVVRDVFELAAAEAAAAFKDAAFAADQVAADLRDVFSTGSAVALDALTAAGFPSQEISEAMTDIFAWSDELLAAANQAFEDFSGHVLDFVGSREVRMVVFNLTPHRLEVTGAYGDEITPRTGLVIEAGGADVVATYGATTGTWEWVHLRDIDTGAEYQLYIQMSSFIGNRYVSFDHLNPAHQKENSGSQRLPPEVASSQWDGSATAAYTLKDLPAAS